MLRTTLLSFTPVKHYMALRVIGASTLRGSRTRYLSLSSVAKSDAPRSDQAFASSPTALGTASSASEGGDQLTTPDAVSTVPTMVRGDWVLFHPVYSPEEVKAVQVLHHKAKNIPDKIASKLVLLARFGFDFVSGYKHKEIPPESNMTVEDLRKNGYLLDEHGWLNRILFLETIAGVPGMVAATLRHLTSLRLMASPLRSVHPHRRGTFMTLRKNSIWFRALILGAQGVFYNMFFLAYIVSPRTCHRFVGHLEEEAVLTYTRCIKDLEAGRIPEWTNKPAPEIAIDYWRLPKDATLLDVLYAVRSDETTHRFVNHSLANLNTRTDINPFALREPDMFVKGTKIAFERDEAEDFVRESREIMDEKREAQMGKTEA
ncbi:unnamed protein product [Mycena citricolor]|uniref:Alternative oxidase n=1 Tax=Mycena citricolor TaxID=2018698 RepID=A0AAD2H3W2_9AGAR|nr:unnamed protein product [Mycena citricolor]